MESLPLSRAASVAILPSAVFCERFSLAARWAYPIQPVLLPDCRPQFQSVGRELGQDLDAVTGSRRLSSTLLCDCGHHFVIVPQWFVNLSTDPQLVKQYGQLPRYRDDRPKWLAA